jgi:hypothetical protein
MVMTSLLPYETWIEDALRAVVRRALAHTAAHGLPGAHHFYITIAMDTPGVDVPAWLRAQYPDEMTVVLQHQFWDLSINEDGFSVTLRFHGREARLAIPFAAITAFGDPAVNFGLQLRALSAPLTGLHKSEPAGGKEHGEAEPERGAGEVITLDSFRKK